TLNLLTWLGTALLAVGIGALSQRKFEPWCRAVAWAEEHGFDLTLLLLAMGLGILTAVRYTIRLGMVGPFTGETVFLWTLSWSSLLAAVWPVRNPAVMVWVKAHKLEVL